MTLAFDSQDENGLQFEKIGLLFQVKACVVKKWPRNDDALFSLRENYLVSFL